MRKQIIVELYEEVGTSAIAHSGHNSVQIIVLSAHILQAAAACDFDLLPWLREREVDPNEVTMLALERSTVGVPSIHS